MRKGLACILVMMLLATAAIGQMTSSSVVDGPVHEGQQLSCDLPPFQQFRNIGSRIDGAGMCVFTSIEMAARAQGLECMRGWRDWCAQNFQGGGYPSKVDKLLTAWGKHKGIVIPDYMQYEGKEPARLMMVIDATRRMACVTYCTSPRYGGQRIAHMVNAPGFHKYGIILDNNFPSVKKGDGWDEKIYEWMPPDELIRRVTGGGSGWVFVWLGQPAPPSPKNKGGS